MYNNEQILFYRLHRSKHWISLQIHSAYTIDLSVITDSHQTRDIDPMLYKCWASVVDGGPTLIQH